MPYGDEMHRSTGVLIVTAPLWLPVVGIIWLRQRLAR